MAADIRRMGQYGDGEALPNAQALAGRLLSTVYMGTANSSDATRSRASELAQQVPSPAASARISSCTKCQMRGRSRRGCGWSGAVSSNRRAAQSRMLAARLEVSAGGADIAAL